MESPIVNTLELIHTRYQEAEKLIFFSTDGDEKNNVLITNSSLFQNEEIHRSWVRFYILPDDIALSREKVLKTSIPNQIAGSVEKIREVGGSCYVILNCGVRLAAEITLRSRAQMTIEEGQTLYCLIKAKAIEVVHFYEKQGAA